MSQDKIVLVSQNKRFKYKGVNCGQIIAVGHATS